MKRSGFVGINSAVSPTTTPALHSGLRPTQQHDTILYLSLILLNECGPSFDLCSCVWRSVLLDVCPISMFVGCILGKKTKIHPQVQVVNASP